MRKAALSVVAVAAFAAAPAVTEAAFQDGQLVIMRVGNGISNPSDPNYIPFNSANKTQPVSLEVYDVTGNSPVFVGSHALPSGSADPNRFVLSGKIDDNDAKITLSSNGQYLVFGGYQENLNVGVSNSNYVVTSNAPRVIGRVDGSFNFSTSVLSDGSYAGVSINAVASDNGQRFWVAGGNTTPGDVGGLRYVPNVGAASVNVTTASFGAQTDSYRGLRMVNGMLYANTPAQNSFNQPAPTGAYRRGVYWMNASGALPASNTPIAASATAIMTSNDGSPTDWAGNYDTSNASGTFYPKTDSVFLDLDNNGQLDTAYGTGGKAEIQKWHYDTGASAWKRDITVDLVNIGSLGDPLVDGDSEANALDAYIQGNTINLFISTDLGILRLQDLGWMGGIVNPSQITGTASATASARTYNAEKYIGYTADDNYRFRGLVMVPEPTGLAMLGLGASVFGLTSRRRRQVR